MSILIFGHCAIFCVCPKFYLESVRIFIRLCEVIYFLKVLSGRSFNKLLVILCALVFVETSEGT